MLIFPLGGRSKCFVSIGLLVACAASCNVYTKELIQESSVSGQPNGADGGGDAGKGGASSTNVVDGSSGGTPVIGTEQGGGSTHVGAPTGGQTASGGTSSTVLPEGTTGGRIGSTSGGTSPGGTSPGGTSPGGTSSGGTSSGGTSSGGTSSGGTSSGGATATTPGGGGTSVFDCSRISPLLIDDMEDKDANIFPCYGKTGNWYTFVSDNDWDVKLQPPPNSVFAMSSVSRQLPANAGNSNFAASISGMTAAKGDCGMGVLLNTSNIPEAPQVFDLTHFGSIRFWYKTEGLTTTDAFRIQLLQTTTVPVTFKGSCSTSGATNDECNDHYSFILPPSTDWVEAKIQLRAGGSNGTSAMRTGFAQESGWGRDVPFELSKVMGVQFIVKAAQTSPFKIFVDDLVLALPE